MVEIRSVFASWDWKWIVPTVLAAITLVVALYQAQKPSQGTFPRFDQPIGDSGKEFADFVMQNEGKVVYIRSSIDGDAASEDEHPEVPGGKRLIYPYDMTEYMFFEAPNESRWYWTNGYYAVDGYFSVELVQGMHQGWTSMLLRGVDTTTARLSDPDARQ